MVKHKAFLYYYGKAPGLGIIARNEQEGWQRVNLYGFGVDVENLTRGIEEGCESELLREGVLAARLAQSGMIIAGGVVFKGITCLTGEGTTDSLFMDRLERGLPAFRIVDTRAMRRADAISPLELYSFTYGKKVIGISRVVFFEYATQMSLVGVYRDQDRNLVDELSGELSGLNQYMTIPKPLRTDERDGRVEVNLFMIRHPLKEELQADFVQAILQTRDLAFYTA